MGGALRGHDMQVLTISSHAEQSHPIRIQASESLRLKYCNLTWGEFNLDLR